MKVLICDKLSEKGKAVFDKEKIPYDEKVGLSPSELAAEVTDYDALVIRSGATVTREVIEAAENLKAVGRAGVGVDNVDLEAASQAGVLVMNTPGGNTISTAEHTFSMLLSMSRNIPQAHASLSSGLWEKAKFKGVEVYGKTLGLIGMGRIGTEVSKRALAFNMNVLAFDPFLTPERARELNVEQVELDRIFRESDYITVHTPLNDKTRSLLNKKAFAIMKEGVRVINCARGGIIDEDDLYDAVKEGKVAGAAMDVFIEEPLKQHKLFELPQVVVTPHLGASTEEAQENVAIQVAQQICNYLKNGTILNAVNVPSVDEKILSILRPYMALGQKLGSFIGQFISGPLTHIEILYSGRVLDYNLQPVTSSVLQGFLNHYSSKPINYINAPYIAKEKGIAISEVKCTHKVDFHELIEVKAHTAKEVPSVAGTIFGSENDPRIVSIDGYRVEAIPSGQMLIISNDDNPGVIGKIGTLLGQHKINITGMSYDSDLAKKIATIALNIENEVGPELIEELKSIDEITSIRLIRL